MTNDVRRRSGPAAGPVHAGEVLVDYVDAPALLALAEQLALRLPVGSAETASRTRKLGVNFKPWGVGVDAGGEGAFSTARQYGEASPEVQLLVVLEYLVEERGLADFAFTLLFRDDYSPPIDDLGVADAEIGWHAPVEPVMDAASLRQWILLEGRWRVQTEDCQIRLILTEFPLWHGTRPLPDNFKPEALLAGGRSSAQSASQGGITTVGALRLSDGANVWGTVFGHPIGHDDDTAGKFVIVPVAFFDRKGGHPLFKWGMTEQEMRSFTNQ